MIPAMRTHCPRCGSALMEQLGGRKLGQTADRYQDCRYICTSCNIGLSNAKSRPTFIRGNWRDGLWRRSTAPRLERLLDQALSDISREKKRRRLANERAEDLLTWNVFSWLETRHLLGHIIRWLGLPEPSDTPSIYYWGATDRPAAGVDLRHLLTRHVGESARSLSEPDVIIVGQASVVFVEAKFGSPNDRQIGTTKTDKYLKAAPGWFRGDSEAVGQSGYYELTRNWAIGGVLAEQLGKRFALVNLIRRGDEGTVIGEFGPLLSDKGVFAVRTWEDLVEAIEPALAAHLQDETLYFESAFPSLNIRHPQA
jgi:hypothetical protein